MHRIIFDGKPTQKIQALGLGVFDGVHLGHQYLAKECDALLTFHPHPDRILNKNSELQYLTTLEEMRLFYTPIIAATFTKELASCSATSFLDILQNELKPSCIVVGYDYRFGYKQEGDFDFLRKWGEINGVITKKIPVFTINKRPVKSGLIRTLLTSGDFDEAIALLGHPYVVSGTVISGDGRGRTIGFPTANLSLEKQKLVPKNGVYRGVTTVQGKHHECMVYIGTKPSFSNSEMRSIEVHILNFEGSLYDSQLQVFMTKKIRNEMTFSSTEGLISQIKNDREEIING
jgi:riboflavin kinase/FMN adenylyltransferase